MTASSVAPLAATACRAASGRSRISSSSQSRNALATAGPSSRAARRRAISTARRPARSAHAFSAASRSLVDGRLRRRFERRGLLRRVAQSSRVRLLGCLLRRLEDRVAFPGEAGARARDVRQRRRCFGALRLRVGQSLLRRVAPLGDHGGDRAPEETPEQPDQDEDVDGLEAERPPVDRHDDRRHFSSGLANSSSSAITRQ